MKRSARRGGNTLQTSERGCAPGLSPAENSLSPQTVAIPQAGSNPAADAPPCKFPCSDDCDEAGECLRAMGVA